jgi:hypothetical protein
MPWFGKCIDYIYVCSQAVHHAAESSAGRVTGRGRGNMKLNQQSFKRLIANLSGSALLLLGVAVTAMTPARTFAQATTAEVVGGVHDQTGAVVPGAKVTLTNNGTNEVRTATSGADGAFAFNLVPPGSYRVSIAAPNFERYEVPSLTLAAGDKPRVNAQLAVGNTSQTVSVESTTPLLQTESATIQSSVNQQTVQDLPLNGRNFVQLVQLAPGVNDGPPNGLTNGTAKDDSRGDAGFSANGQSDLLNNQEIDGMDNNEGLIGTIGVRPSVDAISEIRVQNDVYSGDTGRTGGAAINVISKSGTNNFHGDAYEYFRNDVLNTFPYEFGASNPQKQELRQNQFGFSVGGPIIHNKTFFFGDYEGFRRVQDANPSVATIPTLFEEQNPGDFSDQPASAGPDYLPGNIGPLDPAALNYLKLYPAPNLPNTTASNGLVQGQFLGVPRATQTSNIYDIRLDHQVNQNDAIFGRYSYNHVDTFVPGTFPTATVAGLSVQSPNDAFNGFSPSIAHNLSLSYRHIFTQNLLLQLQAGYLRVDNESYPGFFGDGNKVGPNVNAAFGQPGINISPSTSGLAAIGVNGGYSGLGGGAFDPLVDLTNVFQYQGTVTYTHGEHNVKMGASLIRRQLYSVQSNAQLPQYTFSDLPSFEQGIFTAVNRNLSTANPHYRTWEPDVYIQDDWHITTNTTLNLGLRYDVFTPFTEVNDHISTWNPATQSILVAGQNGVSRTAGIRTVYSNVAPRFGFSTVVHPGLVVRGGAGLSYYPTLITSNASLKNQPFLATYGPFSSVNAVANGYPGFTRFIDGAPPAVTDTAANPTGAIAAATDPQFRPAVAEQFNLAIQQDFTGNVVTIAYVGVLTKHIPQPLTDLNAPPPNTSANANTLRPTYAKYPNLTTIGWYASGGVGNFNSLQLSFQRRITKGLGFNANYTYARDLDNATGLSNENQGGYAIIPALTHIQDYGNSDLDLRNRGVATANYTLPFGGGTRGMVGEFVKGWQVNLIGEWDAGQPFTVLNSSNLSNTKPGGAADRPNRVGNPHLTHNDVAHFFNTAAYSPQAFGTVGSSQRNTAYGPHYRHVDLSFVKTFLVKEGVNVEFRAEGFNITNTANFATPNATLGSGTLGSITALSAAYTPRLIQFALKLNF